MPQSNCFTRQDMISLAILLNQEDCSRWEDWEGCSGPGFDEANVNKLISLIEANRISSISETSAGVHADGNT